MPSSGVAIVHSPAPARIAAAPASTAAPGVPPEPPTTATCPRWPLWAAELGAPSRRATHRGSMSATGRSRSGTPRSPMSATTMRPAWWRPGVTCSPGLLRAKVTVTSATNAASVAAPESGSTPVGMSTAIRGPAYAAIRVSASATPPLGAPLVPVPSSASTTTACATAGHAVPTATP